MRRNLAAAVLLGSGLFSVGVSSESWGHSVDKTRSSPIALNFKGEAQVEIGGPFVGVELHKGSFLPTRISFFYPAANSIYLADDYWTRGSSRIMAMGLKFGDGPAKWLTQKPDSFDLTPWSVVYHDRDAEKQMTVRYEFTRDYPAMVMTVVLKNLTNKAQAVEFATRLDTSLKTSHSFITRDRAWTTYDAATGTIYTGFDQPDTLQPKLFVSNVGDAPVAFTADAADAWTPASHGTPGFASGAGGKLLTHDQQGHPAAAFVYRKTLPPGGELTVRQLIGSAKQSDANSTVAEARAHYQESVDAYRAHVEGAATDVTTVATGEPSLDRSAKWAQAIMAANYHLLEDTQVPMPASAEYNFYFSHDVLEADMAAVRFDPARVRADLEYIRKMTGEDNIIPHARYWKDDKYRIEYNRSDDWIHFWFMLVSASYLRHTGDTALLEKLYPILQKSMGEILTNMDSDGLISAHRPDWWDFGDNYGPRAFMTLMAARSLREMAFISTRLGKDPSIAGHYEETERKVATGLNAHLWDADKGFLLNRFADGKTDPHYYIGSLLAAPLGLLNETRAEALADTATKELLDPAIGIYVVAPMDFLSLAKYMGFGPEEVGPQGKYLNGGVWPHGNAWYTMALNTVGRQQQSYDFIRRVMTLDGIIRSPGGQPAMYEYRNSRKDMGADYGKSDKPQFLWAASWYLYALYDLYGVRENAWNVAIDPWLPADRDAVTFNMQADGAKQKVVIRRAPGETANTIREIRINGVPVQAAVLPSGLKGENSIEVELGAPQQPLLASVKSELVDVVYHKEAGELDVDTRAFAGHENEAVFLSPTPATTVTVDGRAQAVASEKAGVGLYRTVVSFRHNAPNAMLAIRFVSKATS